MITVREHTRHPPEKPADPFKPVIEARKARFCRKWGIQPANTDDARLAQPLADPSTGGPSLASIAAKLAELAKLMRRTA